MKTALALLTAIALASPTSAAAPSAEATAEHRAVEAVLAQFKAAIERRDGRGTEALFTPDSQIFETGGSEGSYSNYLTHHLGPELSGVKSIKFSDYKVTVRFEGPVALAAETYRYRIEPPTGDIVERDAVATSVLKKVGGRWKILTMHNSARRPRAPAPDQDRKH